MLGLGLKYEQVFTLVSFDWVMLQFKTIARLFRRATETSQVQLPIDDSTYHKIVDQCCALSGAIEATMLYLSICVLCEVDCNEHKQEVRRSRANGRCLFCTPCSVLNGYLKDTMVVLLTDESTYAIE